MATRDTEVVQQIVEEIRRRVLDVIGDNNVRCVFVSGSVSRDEVTAHESDGVIELYSDVDIGIVVSSSVDTQAAKERIRREIARIPREGNAFHMYAPPDVGVYRVDEMMRQKARPGTVNFGGAKILYGEPDIVTDAAISIGTNIDPGEALYLIENRLNESAEAERMLTDDATRGQIRYATYIGLKCYLDIATAVLIVLGRYRDTRSERMEALEDPLVRSEMLSIIGDEVAAEIRQCWLALQDLSGFFTRISGNERAFFSTIYRALAHSWRGVALRAYGSTEKEWAELLHRRTRYGKQLRNTRELLALARRMGWGGPRLYRRLFELRMVSGVELLRMTSLLEGVKEGADDKTRHFVNEICVPCLEVLTHLGGISNGQVFERGRALNRAIS
ncbi:MAG: hypothetical protein O7D32_07115 [bacterium]|nr:hypothetical protein [bacterium]